MENEHKQLRWYNLALISFVSVWGFGNVVNNFANQGLQVIVSWILIIGLYFIPYALMVGELGTIFKDEKGGVSSWIRSTYGVKLAYLAGWTYWVVHIPYLAQKPQAVLIALGWVIKGDGTLLNDMVPLVAQSISLLIFFLFLWVASKGIKSLNRIGTIAGTAIFIMSLLYILLVITAPALTGVKIATTDLSVKALVPKFDFSYFTTLSMLVFAVGGAEKISPYVNNTKNSKKEFPRGMIILAIMVTISAILGSIAMAIMFDANNIPKDLMMNGQYYAFKKLGEYYGLGNSLLILYALANMIAQISALVVSIDAPLKVLLGDADDNFVPKSLSKMNDKGVPVNGYIMTAVLVGILIIVPALGIGNMTDLFNWLLRLNAVVMPMRYIWVFLAFIGIKKASEKYNSSYKFVKNDKFALIIGVWCFIFTAFACVMGMFPQGVEKYSPEWIFTLSLNIITPFILLGLGLILPKMARNRKNK